MHQVVIAAGILVVWLTGSSSAGAQDCDPLRPSRTIDTEIRNVTEANANILLRSLGQGSVRNDYQRIEQSQQFSNPDDANRWNSFIYMLCTLLKSSSLSDNDKLVQYFKLVELSRQSPPTKPPTQTPPPTAPGGQRDDQRQASTYARRLTKNMLLATRESRAGNIQFFDPPIDTVIVNNQIFRADFQIRNPGTYVFRLDRRQQRLRLACALSDDIRRNAGYVLRVIGDNNQMFEQNYSIGSEPVPRDIDIAGVETLVFDIAGSPSGGFMLFYCKDDLVY